MGNGCSRPSAVSAPKAPSKEGGVKIITEGVKNEVKVEPISTVNKVTVVQVVGKETDLCSASESEGEIASPKKRKVKARSASNESNNLAEVRAATPQLVPNNRTFSSRSTLTPVGENNQNRRESDSLELCAQSTSSGDDATQEPWLEGRTLSGLRNEDNYSLNGSLTRLPKIPNNVAPPAPVCLPAQMSSLKPKQAAQLEKPVAPLTKEEILSACEMGDEEIIKRFLRSHETKHDLLQNGLPMLFNDKTQTHGLHLSAEYGHTGVLQLLLEAGIPADIDVLPITALGVAALKNQVESCKILLRHGADVHAGNENALTLGSSPEISVLFEHVPKPKRLQPLIPLDKSPKMTKKEEEVPEVEAPPPKEYTMPADEEMIEELEVFEGDIADLVISDNFRCRLYAVGELIRAPHRMQKEYMEIFMQETKLTFQAKVIELCAVIDINIVAAHVDKLLTMKKAASVILRLLVEKQELSDNIYARLTDDLSASAVLVDKWRLVSQLIEVRIPRNWDVCNVLCTVLLKNVEHKKNDVRDLARKILTRLPPDIVRAQLEIVGSSLRDKTYAKLSKQFEAPPKEESQKWRDIKDVEPLSDEVRAFALPLIPLFGEEWTACFYSRMWQARAESILGINELLETQENTDLDLVMRCLNEGLGDANQKVLLAAADVVPPVVRRFTPSCQSLEQLRELQTQLFPIVKALCFHMGDAKELVRNGASRSLLSLASIHSNVGSVMSPGTLCALILTHLSPKQNALGFLCRLSALKDLLKHHKVFASTAQEPQIWRNMGCGMTHPDGPVRKESLKIFLQAFKVNYQMIKDSVEQSKLRQLWIDTLDSFNLPQKVYKEIVEHIQPSEDRDGTEEEVIADDDSNNRTAILQTLQTWSKLSEQDLLVYPKWERLHGCLPFANEEVFIALCLWITLLVEDNLVNALRIIKDAIDLVPLTTFELAMIIPRHLLPNLLGLECRNTRTACSVDRLVRWCCKHKNIPKASSMVARQVVNLIEKEEDPARNKRYLMLLQNLPIEEYILKQLLEQLIEKRCELLNGPITQVLIALKAQHTIIIPVELQDLVRHEGGIRVPLELPPLVPHRKELKEDPIGNTLDAATEDEKNNLNKTRSSHDVYGKKQDFNNNPLMGTCDLGSTLSTNRGGSPRPTSSEFTRTRSSADPLQSRQSTPLIGRRQYRGSPQKNICKDSHVRMMEGRHHDSGDTSTDASTNSPKDEINAHLLKCDPNANLTAGPWTRRNETTVFRGMTR